MSWRRIGLLAIALTLVFLATFGSDLTAAPPQDAEPRDLVNWGVSGHVYRTGTQIGVPGAVVTLYGPDGNTFVASTTTGADGYFWLCCIPCETFPAGNIIEWRVVETDPPGHTSSGAEVIGCDEYPCTSWVSSNNEVGGISKYCVGPTEIRFYDTPPLQLVGVQPSSGSSCAGALQPFTSIVADIEGANQIRLVEHLFDSGAWMQDAVYLRYNHANGRVFLRNDENTAWLGGYPVGSAQTIQNSRVVVDVQQCRVTTSADGRTLSVTWALRFKQAFVGLYDQYLYAERLSGLAVGFGRLGEWRIDHCGSPTPTQTPTATRTPGCTGYAVFQQGFDGYTGARDTWITSWYPDNNYEGDGQIYVRAVDRKAALLKFDISSLGTGLEVISATLGVYVTGWEGNLPLSVEAYRVYRPWVAAEATWKLARAGEEWGFWGCNNTTTDRAATPEDTKNIPGVVGWRYFDLTNLVQEWLDNPNANQGVILKSFGTPAEIQLVSSEHGDPLRRPKLLIRYNCLTPVPTGTPTRTSSPTRTWTHTATSTATPTKTPTVTNTPTWTPSSTRTWTHTATSAATPTGTLTTTGTPTRTPSPTRTWTHTATSLAAPTETLTATGTPTRTPSPTRTWTYTATSLVAPTETPTATGTPTRSVIWLPLVLKVP